MATIKNEDLKVMIEIEELLHRFLEENQSIDENNKDYDLWISYWNIIERFINDKKTANKKSTGFNKRNAEYHRLMNNLCNARKRKDKKKIEYYSCKLEELRNRR